MPDTPSREEQRDEEIAALLERIGYFWGGTYEFDPNNPTWGWLRSDGAGNAVQVTDAEQALIDFMFEDVSTLEVRLKALLNSGEGPIHYDADEGAFWFHRDEIPEIIARLRLPRMGRPARPEPERTGMPKCDCGDIAYRPEPIAGRQQAWRCGGCHRTLNNCNCPLEATP